MINIVTVTDFGIFEPKKISDVGKKDKQKNDYYKFKATKKV